MFFDSRIEYCYTNNRAELVCCRLQSALPEHAVAGHCAYMCTARQTYCGLHGSGTLVPCQTAIANVLWHIIWNSRGIRTPVQYFFKPLSLTHMLLNSYVFGIHAYAFHICTSLWQLMPTSSTCSCSTIQLAQAKAVVFCQHMVCTAEVFTTSHSFLWSACICVQKGVMKAVASKFSSRQCMFL